jgi:hypothetical protein
MGHPDAAGVQRQHAPAVLANQLLLAHRWGQPCRAYNVCTRAGSTGAAALAAIQASTLRLEPSLLRVPEHALHANLAWLLPVHQEFDRPKDELWRRYGPQWIATLADVAARTSSFRLCYRRLVATNSAVITVADEPNRLSALRRELMPLLDVPGSRSAGDLAHITLFRYARPLRDPASLLRWLAATEFRLDIDVSELLVIRERIFPSLNYEILHRLPLAPDSPANDQQRFPGQRSSQGELPSCRTHAPPCGA